MASANGPPPPRVGGASLPADETLAVGGGKNGRNVAGAREVAILVADRHGWEVRIHATLPVGPFVEFCVSGCGVGGLSA